VVMFLFYAYSVLYSSNAMARKFFFGFVVFLSDVS